MYGMARHGKLEAVLLHCMVALGTICCRHYHATSATRLHAYVHQFPGPAIILGIRLLHLSVYFITLDRG